MSGNAFVVGDRLVVDERALGEVRGGDHDAAGTLAVGSAGNVVGGSGSLECGYGLDRDRRLRKKSEKLRKLRLHLRDVVAEIFENLLRGSRFVFGIGFERCPERGEVGEALLLGNSGHLSLDTVDLAETELMNLVRRHVGSGPGVDVVFVALLAVGQRGDRESRTAFGRVLGAKEIREALVRR